MKNIAKLKPNRRNFIKAGMATSAALLSSTSLAQETILEPSRGPGRTIMEMGYYGDRSEYATEARLKGNRGTGLVGGSLTPLQNMQGMITPSGLHFEVHHSGVPDIDPSEHKLIVHGLVGDEKVFTMEDLMRFPAESHFHFLECAGNGMGEWMSPRGQNVQQTHGLTSCSQWTS